jgi:hypothetical protein
VGMAWHAWQYCQAVSSSLHEKDECASAAEGRLTLHSILQSSRAFSIMSTQGPLKFYTGFPTYCVRIAPHVTLTLVFLDALKKAQGNMGM